MANDRIYVRCLKCGEDALIAKYWGGGEFSLPDRLSVDGGHLDINDYIASFFGKHAQECHDIYGQTLGEGLSGKFALRVEAEE